MPREVPTMTRVSGIIITIRMINGMERSRLISTFRKPISEDGSGRIPFFSPVTSSTPRGRPIITAKRVARSVE